MTKPSAVGALTLWTAVSICFAGGFQALAQSTTTPTPGPSKTPTLSAPTATPLPAEASSPGDAAVFQPWTQSDLSILTGNVQRPNGLTWHEGKLYAACNGDFTVYEIDPNTAFTRTYIWGVRNAHTLYAETTPQGELRLWIPDYQTNQLVYVERTGVRPIASDLNGPWGIAPLNSNQFLITSLLGNSLLLMQRDGTYHTIVSDLRAPTGVAADGPHVFVANTGSARRAIEWLSLEELLGLDENDSTPQPKPLVSGLQNTTGLVTGPDGLLYFAYALGTRGVVGRVNPAMCLDKGGCSNTDVEIVVFTELAAPLAGLTISPDMRMFVHTMFSPDIYWVQLDAAEEPESQQSATVRSVADGAPASEREANPEQSS